MEQKTIEKRFYEVSNEFVAMVNKLSNWATIWVNFSTNERLFNGLDTRIFRDHRISDDEIVSLKKAIAHFFLYFPSFRSEQLKNACDILDYIDRLYSY